MCFLHISYAYIALHKFEFVSYIQLANRRWELLKRHSPQLFDKFRRGITPPPNAFAM